MPYRLQPALFLLAGLSLGAAQAAGPAADAQKPEPRQSAPAAATPKACKPTTGSRLRHIDTLSNCDEAGTAPFVQSYSRDELLGADAFNLARALSHLNASVQLR